MSRVSIQSKLLVMLLMTSVLSAAVVGSIGYSSGRHSLQASVFDRLTEIRQSQSRQLQAKFSDLDRFTHCVFPRLRRPLKPSRRSSAGSTNFRTHQSTRCSSSRSSTTTTIVSPRSRKRRPATPSMSTRCCPRRTRSDTCRPTTPLPSTTGTRRSRFDDARDGSAWSAANARFNDFFREIVLRFEFEDALLLDTRGQRRLQRLQGRRSRHQHPHRPVPRQVNCATPTRRRWLQRRRLCRRHRLRRLPARRRTDRVDGVAPSARTAESRAFSHCSFRSRRSTG